MRTIFTRRDFLKASGASVALAMTATCLSAADQKAPVANVKRPLKKAMMWATVGLKGSMVEKMKAIKEAGFDGVEMVSHLNPDEVLKARHESGLEIPSVCGAHHWTKPLSHSDPKIREEGLEALKQSLRDAKHYGASSVLLVPGVVNKDISYNDAYQRSQEEIRKAIPLAEELGVKIAIENVWNQFLLSPLEAARYVDEFKSDAVGWHFDIGNVINTGWPEQWIRILGKRIKQLHVKEFSRTKADKEGKWAGFKAQLLEGDDNWPAVMKAIDEIGYRGWAITEQPGTDSDTLEKMKDLAARVDKILGL
jgi:L-ribulose-5-phosphate 3-epimerase